ncbi:hypothetical protein [Streptomyces mexicanus]|uniref:hypothetical protein n=1 Tax=Streptomyces mexicanus TaxID=178566 RepID=UPI0036A0C13D
MTVSAAPARAALRVARTAAARRALYLVLLVGALFALGLLCGERAQAAEAVPSPARPSQSAPEAPLAQGAQAAQATQGVQADGPARSNRSPGRPLVGPADVAGAVVQVLGPVTDVTVTHVAGVTEVAGSVVGPVAGAVGSRVDGTVGGLVDVVTGVTAGPDPGIPPVVSSPVPPGLPEPSVPTVPRLPGPAGSVPSTGPSPSQSQRHQDPRPQHRASRLPSAPSRPEDVPGPTAAEPATVPGDAPVSAADRPGTAVVFGPPAIPGALAQGTGFPASTSSSAPAGATDSRADHRDQAGDVPAHHAPTGDPDGALGNRLTADSGAPRHGDLHAVTPGTRRQRPLLSGSVARAGTAGTRDAARDVPVLPD